MVGELYRDKIMEYVFEEVLDNLNMNHVKHMIINAFMGGIVAFFVYGIIDKYNINFKFILHMLIFISIFLFVYIMYIKPKLICQGCIREQPEEEDSFVVLTESELSSTDDDEEGDKKKSNEYTKEVRKEPEEEESTETNNIKTD